MTNKELNQRASKLYKEFTLNRSHGGFEFQQLSDTNQQIFWKLQKEIGEKANDILRVVGGIEALSKNNIIRMMHIVSITRCIEPFKLYMEFSKACEDMKL